MELAAATSHCLHQFGVLGLVQLEFLLGSLWCVFRVGGRYLGLGKLFQVGLGLVYEWLRGLCNVCLRCYSVLVQNLVQTEFC